MRTTTNRVHMILFSSMKQEVTMIKTSLSFKAVGQIKRLWGEGETRDPSGNRWSGYQFLKIAAFFRTTGYR